MSEKITRDSFLQIADELMEACNVGSDYNERRSSIQKIRTVLEDQGIIEILHENIGTCFAHDGKYEIEKSCSGQGVIFKSWDAYENGNAPCYVPELSDKVYTRKDFLELCNGQPEIADEVFNAVDWQHPETYLDEAFVNKELAECPDCSLLYWTDGTKICPYCGKNFEEMEAEQDKEQDKEPTAAVEGNSSAFVEMYKNMKSLSNLEKACLSCLLQDEQIISLAMVKAY